MLSSAPLQKAMPRAASTIARTWLSPARDAYASVNSWTICASMALRTSDLDSQTSAAWGLCSISSVCSMIYPSSMPASPAPAARPPGRTRRLFGFTAHRCDARQPRRYALASLRRALARITSPLRSLDNQRMGIKPNVAVCGAAALPRDCAAGRHGGPAPGRTRHRKAMAAWQTGGRTTLPYRNGYTDGFSPRFFRLNVISTANLTIQFGPKPLFENVSVKFGGRQSVWTDRGQRIRQVHLHEDHRRRPGGLRRATWRWNRVCGWASCARTSSPSRTSASWTSS